jgi:hypothetical protein
VNVGAWCGHCGQSFRLVESVTDGAAGSCPRCGRAFDPAYTAVVVTAVRQLLAAAGSLSAAAHQLREVAPSLHIDRAQLYRDLDADLDR